MTEGRKSQDRTAGTAAMALGSGFARDLQDPDVRHARSGSDRAEALTRPDSLPDSLPPFGLGSGTARRSAPHAGQGGHLPGRFDSRAEGVDGLGAAWVVEADGDAEGFGFAAEAVVGLCFTDELCVGHSGNLAYRADGVKW